MTVRNTWTFYIWYCVYVSGKCSALHMLVKVGHEVLEGMACAGLELLCRYKPYTEHKNSAGKTPLIMAVEDQSKRALDLLVGLMVYKLFVYCRI